jgi:hypothetical protein
MTPSSVQLLEGGGIAVRFAFHEDRYSHEILLADGSQWIPILKSVEGSPDDEWPASPPLQSLHLETRPGNRQLALLVGMAGHSHWSMSVELDSAAARVTFDVACRTRAGAVERLGSRYKALQPLAEHGRRRAIVVPTALAPVRLAIEICEPFGDARLETNADFINLIAVPTSSAQPQTVRWGYAVSREPGLSGSKTSSAGES